MKTIESIQEKTKPTAQKKGKPGETPASLNSDMVSVDLDAEKEEASEEEEQSEHDSSGEYREEVWNRDLKIRINKTKFVDSEIERDDLQIEKDNNDEALEDFYGEAFEGDYFGDLGINQGAAKPMSAWCLRNTHFLVITKKVIDRVLLLMKQRLNQEKISFLKALPAFKTLSQSKVRGMID